MGYDVRDGSAVSCEQAGASVDATMRANQAAIQNALDLGRLTSITTPGAYRVVSDSFDTSSGASIIIGPGVSFIVDGEEVTLYSLECIRVANVDEAQFADMSGGGVMVPVLSGRLHAQEGSPLDLSALRTTAVPAGSNGRIIINTSDVTKFAEANAPTTDARMLIATWAPDATESPLPDDKDQITRGVEYLSRCGFNAIRLHGIEYWIMAGTTTELEFPVGRLDLFDWLLSECKRVGLYWIINPRQPELYQAGPSRFSMPGTAKNYKERIFTQQNARDNWHSGFNLLYNRTNPYTGINILKDPALFLVECMNECSAQQVAQVAWPTTWSTRDSTQGTGAKTWVEWLQDTTAAHGYANLAAVNASWGTAYGSYAAIPEPSGTELPSLTLASTQRAIDVVLYIGYLDDQLAAYFDTEMTSFGYTGLYCSIIAFPNSVFMRDSAKAGANDVVNLHNYTFLAATPAVSASLDGGATNSPVWAFDSWLYTGGIYTSSKPAYLGEYGWPYWGQYRNQYPMLSAFLAMQGGAGISLFYQGDFFSDTYNVDARFRVRALYPLSGHGDPVVKFSQLVMFFAYAKKYVTEASVTKTIVLNDRYYGVNPRSTTRINRAFYNLFLCTYLVAGLTKTRLNWTSVTTDDTLDSTENAKSWATICSDMLSATAITSDNAAYVSVQANNGSIVAVTTAGTVGSVTASLTQPVIEVTSHTLADGDQIVITNMAGTPGTWPGTNNKGTRVTVALTGVANKIQLVSGCNLTAALSGANFTSGTWCEIANEMHSGSKELYVSRRKKICLINTSRLKYFADGGALTSIYPYSTWFTNLTVESCSTGAAFFIVALDGAALTASTSILIGLVGNTLNFGTTFTTSANTTLATVGEFPIVQDAAEAVLTLTRTVFGRYVMRALRKDGTTHMQGRPGIVGNKLRIALNVDTHQTNYWHLLKTE